MTEYSKIADDLERLCCAETEGKFFDYVTESIGDIIKGLRSIAQQPSQSPSLMDQLTEWFDELDFDRSHEATRNAEFTEMQRIVRGHAAAQAERAPWWLERTLVDQRVGALELAHNQSTDHKTRDALRAAIHALAAPQPVDPAYASPLQDAYDLATARIKDMEARLEIPGCDDGSKALPVRPETSVPGSPPGGSGAENPTTPFPAMAALLTTLNVMKSAHSRGSGRLMSIWGTDIKAVEAAVEALSIPGGQVTWPN